VTQSILMPSLVPLSILQPGPSSGNPRSISEQWGRFSAGDDATQPYGQGMFDSGNVVADDNGSALVASADGLSFQQTTGVALGSNALVASAASGSVPLVARPFVVVKFNLNATTNRRFFAGLSQGSGATMVSADAPATGYVGLQYSTSRGDANWQWAQDQNGGGAQVLTNSGVAVDALAHYLILNATTSSTIVATITTAAGVILDQRTLSGASLPGSTTLLILSSGLENRTAGTARSVDFFWAEARLRPA